MTRINLPHPRDLLDQHLIAEYRELPRIFALAAEALARSGGDLDAVDVPNTYRLGSGHVRFFYTRTGWLAERQADLIAECLSRGFALAHTTPPAPIPGLDRPWTPTRDDLAISLQRLDERQRQRPGFYRYRGQQVADGWYESRPCALVLPRSA